MLLASFVLAAPQRSWLPNNGLRPRTLAATGAVSSASGVVWEHLPHTVDAVISHKHRLVYVDNVKAGSTTLRDALQKVLNASWNHGDCCASGLSENEQTERGCQVNHGFGSRTTTRCLNATHAGYFHFSFVRHPVSKFESGVRQAWFQTHGSLGNLTADELLERQLGTGPRVHGWINEHFQSNTYRLTGFTHQQAEPVQLDFVGRLEDFEADLSRAADLYDATMASSTPCAAAHAADASSSGPPRCGLRLLFEHLRGASEKTNSREEVDASLLSEHGIATLCASDEYVGSPSSVPLATALDKYECTSPEASRAVTMGINVKGGPVASFIS